MAYDILPYPNITAKDPEEQLSQINNYLIQLKETLEFALTNISADNLSPQLLQILNDLGSDIKTTTQEQEDQIQQIAHKSLTVYDVINSEAFGKALDEATDDVRKDIPTDYIVTGEQTATSAESGGVNVYTFTDSNGDTSTFEVRNGAQGAQGTQGPKGDKGDTGAQGPKGDAPTITFSVDFNSGELTYASS